MNDRQMIPDPQLLARMLLQRLELGKPAETDPQGSYTGRPVWGKEPVQDADDL